MYKRLTEVQSDLENLHQKGLQRGASVGWDWSAFPFTIKLGTTTYLAAPPHQGKTEFWFEILINLSWLHGWKHCIFSQRQEVVLRYTLNYAQSFQESHTMELTK